MNPVQLLDRRAWRAGCRHSTDDAIMITRAQAEALLTLAEALEACEQVGVTLMPGDDFVNICFPDDSYGLEDIDGMSVRLAVHNLVPKHTGS